MPTYTIKDTKITAKALTIAIGLFNYSDEFTHHREVLGLYDITNAHIKTMCQEYNDFFKSPGGFPLKFYNYFNFMLQKWINEGNSIPKEYEQTPVGECLQYQSTLNTTNLKQYNLPVPPDQWVAEDYVYEPEEDSNEKKAKASKSKKFTDANLTTIGSLYKYGSLSNYRGLEGNTPVRADTTYVGIEIELEHVHLKHLPEGTWEAKEDGSLKINGTEFVTIPIRFKYLEIELSRLFQGLGEGRATPRCSAHVHINVRDFTMAELHSFILLYLIFEHSMYRFSGNRLNNNFCVPMSFSPTLIQNMLQNLDKNKFLPFWYKYSGFNLAPIYGGDGSHALGTIEFRHLEGTTNISYILNWINLIVSLKISAKHMKPNEIIDHIQHMNTSSGYYWLAESVFKNYAPLLTGQPTFKDDVEHCITLAKSILFTKPQHPIYEEEITILNRRQICVA